MLRYLFKEAKRENEGIFREAMEALNQYVHRLERGVLRERKSQSPQRASQQAEEAEKLVRTVIIRAGGFIRALDELEQSKYAAEQFSRLVQRRFIEEMEQEERDHYHRYLYFYKNALLRIFSTLDKLGYFLDERLGLRTDQVKPQFSYFTVLRRMHQRRPDLRMDNQLFEIKERFQPPMTILRKQRNTETHFLNAELVDDLLQAKMELFPPGKTAVESLEDNLRTLNQGFEMVCRSLTIAFAGLSHELDRASRPSLRKRGTR